MLQLEHGFNYISKTFVIPFIILININLLGYILGFVIKNGIVFHARKEAPDEKILFEPKITSSSSGY